MENHKIFIKQHFCIAEVCFRSRTFFNCGKVVIDVETYNFAGILTDDKIVGYLNENEYKIFYTKRVCDIEQIPFSPLHDIVSTKEEYLEFYCGGRYMTGNIEIDLKNAIIPLTAEDVLHFKELCTDVEEAKRVLQYNVDCGLVEIIRK